MSPVSFGSAVEKSKVKKSFTIHDLPASERPRERLRKFGAEALSAQEILAVILGRGISGESVMVTAQRLLSQFGSLKGIAVASLEELAGVRGIGLAKAAQIRAVFELVSRIEDYHDSEKREVVKTPEDVVAQVRSRGTTVLYCVLVMFAHNHPSGDPEASEDDISLTKRLADAGEIMGIDVLDHVIIGDRKYLSLKREGMF
jgi:DNA repair protein RadC